MIVRELITRLGFRVDGAEAQRYDATLRRIQSTATTVAKISSGLLAGALGLSIGRFRRVADEMTDFRSRLSLALGPAEDLDAIMARLNQTANNTYSSFEQTIEAFLTNNSALRELGYTTDEIIGFTQALNDALMVSGTKGEDAASVMQNLTRAMSMGVLKGDQFNAIVQRGGRLLDLLKEHFGANTEELRQLAAAGEITGDVVMQILLGNMERLRGESEAMATTTADAVVVLNNNIDALMDRFNQAGGITDKVAAGIMFLANNLWLVEGAIIALTATTVVSWIVSFATNLGVLLPMLAPLAAGIRAVGAAMWAIGTNPASLTIAAIAAGIAALIAIGYDFYRWVSGGESYLKDWFGPWEDVVASVKAAWQGLVDFLSETFGAYLGVWRSLLTGDLQGAWENLTTLLGNLWSVLWSVSIPGILERAVPGIFDPLRNAFDDVMSGIRAIWDGFWSRVEGGLSAARNSWVGRQLGLDDASVEARASGGPVRSGSRYLVGEQGPELFVPGSSGWVLPAALTAALGGGYPVAASPSEDGGQTVNFGGITIEVQVTAAPGVTDQDARLQGRSIGEEIDRALDRRLEAVFGSAQRDLPLPE